MDKDSVLIGNIWQRGEGQAIQTFDPVYGNVLWEGHAASADQVDTAVEYSQEIFNEWSQKSLEERIEIIQHFQKIVEKEKVDFAKIISCETGKPLWEAIYEVETMINKVDASISAYKIRTGQQQQIVNNVALIVRHRPVGILGVIGPYNFPGHIPNGHIIPALLAGNTVIYKPSELTPLVAKYTMAYWINAGLPAHVMNLVIGGAEVAQAMINNKNINGFLFTGSRATGKSLHEALSGQPERIVALEMGGNNPLIVSDIDNIDAAVMMTILSAYLTSGQRCTCSRRLIVVEDKNTTTFLNRLAFSIQNIDVAPYDQTPQPFMSSIIRADFAQRLLTMQEELIEKGGHVITKMNLVRPNTGMLTPGLIDVSAIKNRADREIFGPLLQVIRVKHFEEALIEANNTSFGLAAGLLSKNAQHFEHFLASVRAGIVNWNRPTTGASSLAPFGGIGYSGNFRPGAFYMADSCAFPVASMEASQLKLPAQMPIGLEKIFTDH